ncbi:MAG: SWIM zinc finger family protein [Janthinobacterium lividum]
MFTRQTLRKLANATSFERGDDYYNEDSVEKLRREGNEFTARVRGTQNYRVSLLLTAAGPQFSCSCPYNFDGICKHEVALGLAVLDAYGSELVAEPDQPVLTDIALVLAVKTAWADRKKRERLRFLKEALAKNDDLARQFLAFGQATAVPAAGPRPSLLADLAERLNDTLAALSFDEDLWEEVSEQYGYDDEGDGMLALANEQIQEALAPFVAELLRTARGGQLTEALRYWAAACAGIYQVEEPDSDEYGLFGDYGEDVLHQWHQALAAEGWPGVLLAAVLPPAETQAALAWLGSFLADPAAQWPGFDASWLPLLQTLAASASLAPPLLKLLPGTVLTPDTQAHLRLRLAQTLGDDTTWAKTAETLLPTDPAVAQQLLGFYASKADHLSLLRTATTAFTTWPDQFGDYVLRSFSTATAPDLYRAALRHRALANGSLPDFEQLRPLLAPAEVLAFVQAATAAAKARRGSISFAAELLTREGQTGALRRFVLDLEWLFASPAAAVDRALALLAEHDPTPLMLELETRTRAYLNGRANAKRGVVLYGSIAQWLALVRRANPRMAEPVLRLVQELRAEFPTLRRLKEELEKVGLLAAKR